MTSLADFRKGAPKAPATQQIEEKTKREWHEPTLDDFPTDAAVIGVDQSLAATGLVCLLMQGGQLLVHRAGVLRATCSDDLTGWERHLQLADNLQRTFVDELRGYTSRRTRPWRIYNEAPPITSPGRNAKSINRPESSVLAASALVTACTAIGLDRGPMIRSMDWKRITIGVPGATKSQIKVQLMPFAQRLGCQNLSLVTNEPTRDALGVALACMIREHRAGHRR